MTERKIGGYLYREQINRAENATRATRVALHQLIDTEPGPQRTAALVAKAAVAQMEILEALAELKAITGQRYP